MIRDLELAFIKIHILYHAEKEEVFGVGLMDELESHGYRADLIALKGFDIHENKRRKLPENNQFKIQASRRIL